MEDPPAREATDDTHDMSSDDVEHQRVERITPPTRLRNKRPAYLYDRCHGRSPSPRPPHFLCWVPHFVIWWPYIMEQNFLFRCFGRLGCVARDNFPLRQRIFSWAVAANAVALVLTLFACFALSMTYYILAAASFSKGTATLILDAGLNRTETLFLDLGLRGVAITSQRDVVPSSVVPFGDFCETSTKYNSWFVEPDSCDACHVTSLSYSSTCILGLVLIFPSITTDVLRMYPNYDVNCQKVFGSMASFLSMLLSYYTVYVYRSQCFYSFQNGYRVDNSSIPFELGDGSIVYATSVYWSAGYGLICMVAATTLKFVDIAANWIIPTPTITRSRDEQEQY